MDMNTLKFKTSQKARLAVIGSGRLAQGLLHVFAHHHVFDVHYLVNRSGVFPEALREKYPHLHVSTHLQDIASVDVILIATPDNAISDVAHQLASNPHIDECIVFHGSGALSSEILQSLRVRACSLASVHPVFSFTTDDKIVEKFAGTYCAVEGDDKAKSVLTSLLAQCGAQCFDIHPLHKMRYHAACVMANNYVVSLLHVAQNALISSGVSVGMAEKMATDLAQQAVSHSQKKGAAAALTGPIVRGDWELVAQHLSALKAWDDRVANLYDAFIEPTKNLAQK